MKHSINDAILSFEKTLLENLSILRSASESLTKDICSLEKELSLKQKSLADNATAQRSVNDKLEAINGIYNELYYLNNHSISNSSVNYSYLSQSAIKPLTPTDILNLRNLNPNITPSPPFSQDLSEILNSLSIKLSTSPNYTNCNNLWPQDLGDNHFFDPFNSSDFLKDLSPKKW